MIHLFFSIPVQVNRFSTLIPVQVNRFSTLIPIRRMQKSYQSTNTRPYLCVRSPEISKKSFIGTALSFSNIYYGRANKNPPGFLCGKFGGFMPCCCTGCSTVYCFASAVFTASRAAFSSALAARLSSQIASLLFAI